MILKRILVMALAVGMCAAPVRAAEPQSAGAPSPAANPADEAAKNFVRHFFAARDAGDVAAVKAMVDPDAKIIGAQAQEVPFTDLLKGGKPLIRQLSHYEIVRIAPVTMVFFEDAEFESTGSATYMESWFLKDTPAGLKAIWGTYSVEGAIHGPTTTRPVADVPIASGLSPRDQKIADVPERFFDVYTRYLPAETQALFLPGAKIVHDDGSIMPIPQLIDYLTVHDLPVFRNSPPARSQMYGNREIIHAGPVAIISFDNHVNEWRFGHPDTEHVFRETWMLEEMPGGPKAAWVAYSLYGAITKGKDSK